MDPVLAFTLLKYGLLGTGGLFVVIGLITFLKRCRKYSRSVKVDGRTVGMQSKKGWVKRGQSREERITFYMPEVEFTAADGSKHRFTDSLATDKEPVLGSVLPVRYDPDHPQDAFVATFASAWMVPLVCEGMGCTLLLLSLLLL